MSSRHDENGASHDPDGLAAGAVRADVAPYGVPLRPRDTDPQRLNIEVDQDQVIQRMRCG